MAAKKEQGKGDKRRELSWHLLCADLLYTFKAARRAARAANTARTPQLPLALPQRRRQRRSAGAKSAKSRAANDIQAVTRIPSEGGVLAPAAVLSEPCQNPSRPSVTAGQPHRRTCPVNVHVKTTSMHRTCPGQGVAAIRDRSGQGLTLNLTVKLGAG